jgi:geranylgeranyl diphosphate synthase type I
MMLSKYFQTCLPAIENELQAAINRADGPRLAEFRHMLAYHMGWEGQDAGPDSRGKRIRPMLVLLTTTASGGDWQIALPAASAVELIHNFSLIHDDIEDQSPYRRGRLTVWKKWNIAQATNAGDAMFTLAHIEILRLANSLPPEIVIRAARLLHQTCLHLTQGQFLDLAYEKRYDLDEVDYWAMISGKTAALLAACTELGAMVSMASEAVCEAYHRFGYSLGLAFQAHDDLLGIWGDAELTGKSNESDLVIGKKSLPVIYGLSRKGSFYQRYLQGPITPEEVPSVARLLADDGAKEYTQVQTDRLTDQAIQSLETAQPHGEARATLIELAHQLLHRQY